MAKEIPWKTLSEAYAFIGNSLLKPMTMTSTAGSASSLARAAMTCWAAVGPWTKVLRTTKRAAGQRRVACR